MKKLCGKLWAKLTALALLCIFAVLLALCAIGAAWLASEDAYVTGPDVFVQRTLFGLYTRISSDFSEAREFYVCELRSRKDGIDYDRSYYTARFSPESTNFYFTVTDSSGKLLYESVPDAASLAYQFQSVQETDVTYHWKTEDEVTYYRTEAEIAAYLDALQAQNFQLLSWSTTELPAGTLVGDEPARYRLDLTYRHFDFDHIVLHGYLRSEPTVHDTFYYLRLWLERLYAARFWLLAAAGLLILLCLAEFIFLLCAAGHREGAEGIRLSWPDRIPTDLFLAGMGLLAAGLVMFASEFGFDANNWLAMAVLTLGFYLALLLVFTLTCMSLAVRMKAGSFFSNSILFRLWSLLARFVRWIWGALRLIPLLWKAALLWGLFSLITLVPVLDYCDRFGGELLIWWCLAECLLTPAVFYGAKALRELQKGGEALASGDLRFTVPTGQMTGALRRHAENLNSIAQGLQKAVEERTRSERFRAELITNVSHDIKTPLTSIVNYVDLLKKEPIESEKAREYIAVLDRQSARLKKLTEDLVEASKASSGALPVTLESTDVNVLLGQVAGEYLDRLEANRLEPVFQPDPDGPKIMADGQLLWRVFDNLMSNICKYAMPGTRVYFSSLISEGQVFITFKNVSREALNIPSAELMERFVRGDGSRHTEGSGLGLSIAQSLTELQHGRFEIAIDGDLFKAVLTFELLGITPENRTRSR